MKSKILQRQKLISKSILGIIPARRRSKGIPEKNIKLLNGKPLIFYTIKEALKSKFLDEVVVSTEDKKIAKIAKNYGAKVIKRPRELARDTTPTIDVILHVLDVLEGKNYKPDIVVLLQPTSPLRKADHIDSAIDLFLRKNCDFLVSVCQTKKPPHWWFKIERDYMKPILSYKGPTKRRQDLPKTYIPNGAIYISTPEKLRKSSNYFNGRTVPYIMSLEESIDIDDELDFLLAEILMVQAQKNPKIEMIKNGS